MRHFSHRRVPPGRRFDVCSILYWKDHRWYRLRDIVQVYISLPSQRRVFFLIYMFSVCPTYASEIAPPNLRGRVGGIYA
jgi:hypothetical protein